jgi:predicted dehydrogenase/threonine dehydrogenase-like Zn-dependent dehydrogenase
MKQIVHISGNVEIQEIPIPVPKENHMIIQTTASVLSIGTERTALENGKLTYYKMAKKYPDKVKNVIKKIGSDGLFTTAEIVQSKMSNPSPLGYSSVGIVHSIGRNCKEFNIGDRVISNGFHSEYVSVAKNLCARVPDNVDDESAAFTVIASIGLQGIRLIDPSIGENVAVIGLGPVGLLSVQILKANGCNVIGFDFDEKKLELAKQFGAEIHLVGDGDDLTSVANSFTNEKGIDAVLITAATDSNEPIHNAAQMCRKKGRIVLVGVTGPEISRADFYEKELSFQVSCSYGPGRYDPSYEKEGIDYPIGFVRWTEQRNFEAVLELMSKNKLDTKSLTTSRYSFDDAPEAYAQMLVDKSAIGIILKYNTDYSSINDLQKNMVRASLSEDIRGDKKAPIIGVIGAGSFAQGVFLPLLKNHDAQLKIIADHDGVKGKSTAKRFGFQYSTTDYKEVIKDPDINTIFILTKHNTHSSLVLESIRAGKNVFVEKPLAIYINELEEIKETYNAIDAAYRPLLMVGFNRRFAPQIQKLKKILDDIHAPKTFVFTINAGVLNDSHWVHNPEIGGGRIIGEACHFIDLMRFLAGETIAHWSITALEKSKQKDTLTVNFSFAGGSIGTLHYLSNGHNSFPKERIEVFTDGSIVQLDNFIKMTAWGISSIKKYNLRKQDKGHNFEIKRFLKSIADGLAPPIPFDELFEVSNITADIANEVNN